VKARNDFVRKSSMQSNLDPTMTDYNSAPGNTYGSQQNDDPSCFTSYPDQFSFAQLDSNDTSVVSSMQRDKVYPSSGTQVRNNDGTPEVSRHDDEFFVSSSTNQNDYVSFPKTTSSQNLSTNVDIQLTEINDPGDDSTGKGASDIFVVRTQSMDKDEEEDKNGSVMVNVKEITEIIATKPSSPQVTVDKQQPVASLKNSDSLHSSMDSPTKEESLASNNKLKIPVFHNCRNKGCCL